jgi:hypothetical protein
MNKSSSVGGLTGVRTPSKSASTYIEVWKTAESDTDPRNFSKIGILHRVGTYPDPLLWKYAESGAFANIRRLTALSLSLSCCQSLR